MRVHFGARSVDFYITGRCRMPLEATTLDEIDPIQNPQSYMNIWAQRAATIIRNLALLSIKVRCKYFVCLQFPTADGPEYVTSSSAQPDEIESFFTGDITDVVFQCIQDATPHDTIMERLERFERAAAAGVMHPNLLQRKIDPTDPHDMLSAAMSNLADITDILMPHTVPPQPEPDITRSFRDETQEELIAQMARHHMERDDRSMTPRAWVREHDTRDMEQGTEPNTVPYIYPNRGLHAALFPKAKGKEPLMYSKLSLGADGSAYKVLEKAKRTGGNVVDILKEKHKAKRTIKKKKARIALEKRIQRRMLEKQRNRKLSFTGMSNQS